MTTQTDLKSAPKTDWDNYNPGSTYQAPPVPVETDGTTLRKFFGTLPIPTVDDTNTDEGFLQFLLDPIVLAKNGAGIDGYTIRFSRASVKHFTNRKTGKEINASGAGNVLRSVGIQARPQTNDEFKAAMKLVGGKIGTFTLDWFARDKDSGEVVRGYQNFPNDPDRPGSKKAILRAGDTYTDRDGATQVVKSEVLFANAVVRYWVDPSRGKK